MATSSISLHQKKLEFEDNQFLSSLFGYHDKNLKVLEDKFKVKLYSRGNLLSIKGNRDPVEKAYFIIQGLYQKLKKVDLNKTIQEEDNSFDTVMCVGTFTFGHVKPPALDEFIRITKNKGFICFTINEGIYKEYGFDKKIKELSEKKMWDIKEFFKSDYIASKDVNAWLGIAEVIK